VNGMRQSLAVALKVFIVDATRDAFNIPFQFLFAFTEIFSSRNLVLRAKSHNHRQSSKKTLKSSSNLSIDVIGNT
jgi:hypothetical protein